MSEQNRRKVLKSIAAGGGAIVAGKSLPESWSKPVVNAVMLPAHAETTDDTGSQPTTTIAPTTTCTPCLVAATFCAGAGDGSMQLEVAVDGTLTLTHSNYQGLLTDTVDPCTGGDFSFVFSSPGAGTISLSGAIPCGPTSSITVQYSDGSQSGSRDMTTDCIPT